MTLRKVYILACTLALIALYSPATIAEPTQVKEAFQLPVSDKVSLLQLANDTLLLAGTNAGLHCFDAETGSPIWSANAPYFVGGWKIGQITNSPYAITISSSIVGDRSQTRFDYAAAITDIRNILGVINMDDGSQLWSSQEQGIHSVAGFFMTPNQETILLITRDINHNMALRSMDISTGEILWTNSKAYDRQEPSLSDLEQFDDMLIGSQAPVFNSDSTMVTFLAAGLLRMWNINTGAVIWESEMPREELAPLSEGFMQMKLSTIGKTLYVPVHKFLYRLDLRNGRILWTSPQMWGNVYQAETHGHVLLVRGGYHKGDELSWKAFMVPLSLRTGRYRWEKQFTKLKTTKTSNFIIEGDSAVIFKGKEMLRICIKDGGYNNFASNIKVRGSINLSTVEDGYQLLSGESVAFIEGNGELNFNTTYKRPGRNGLEQIGVFLAGVAASVALSATLGAISGSGGFLDAPIISFGLKPYGDLSQATDKSLCMIVNLESERSKKKLKKRRKWFEAGIARVRISDGATLSKITLKDKNPVFTFSEALSKLYYADKNSTIQCIDFP